MEILIIAVTLTIAASVIILDRSIRELNLYGERKYRYEPINFWTVVPISVTYLLLFIDVYSRSHDLNNIDACIFLIILTTIFVCIRISFRSSANVALMSIPILHGTAIVGIFVAFLVWCMLFEGQSRNNDK